MAVQLLRELQCNQEKTKYTPKRCDKNMRFKVIFKLERSNKLFLVLAIFLWVG